MNSAMVAAGARHILTIVGGGLAVKYDIDGESINAIISGLATFVGVAWSLWEKRNRF
jgi:phage shock protein PspC (stress-responsive transcriptional regulator)